MDVVVEDIGVRDPHGEFRISEKLEFEWDPADVGKPSGTGLGDVPVVVARSKYGFLKIHSHLSHPSKVLAIRAVHVHGVIRGRNSPGKHKIAVLENAEIPRLRRKRLQSNDALEAAGRVEKADARKSIEDSEALLGRPHDRR